MYAKVTSLVDCNYCKDWDDKRRMYSECSVCHGKQQVPDPKELLCNLCGECMCPLGTHNEQCPHGLFEAKVTGRYDSYHLLDLNTYIFSFCEKCLRKLFIQCKIKPLVYDTNIVTGELEGEYGWDQDQESYEEILWRNSDGPHQAYLNKKCNQRKNCNNDAIYSMFYNSELELRFTEETSCEEHKPFFRPANKIAKPYVSPKLKPFL